MSANATSESSSSSSTLTPQGQRSSPQLTDEQLMFQVFDNPTLREEILKRAIIGPIKKVDLRAACTLRLVQKSWDQSVLGILWKRHEHLFEVDPGSAGNFDAAIKTFAVSSGVTTRDLPPPLYLEGFSSLCEEKEILQFLAFVTKCSPALLEMDIDIHEAPNRRCIPSTPWLSLSRLHKLKFSLSLGPGAWMTKGNRKQGGSAAKVEKQRLIETIFRGATALAKLELSIFDHSFRGPAPDVTFLDSLAFPPTLIKIKLEIDLEVERVTVLLNTLVRSPLPNVTSFSLTTWKPIFSNGQLLFSILDKWKTDLKTLAIVGNFEEPGILCPIRLPVMEQLEKFTLTAINAVLEEAGPDSVQSCLPKLRTLRLRHQTLGLLRKWTESSVFAGVTHLELLLAENDGGRRFEDEMDENPLSVNADAMQLVNAAFPNLRKLGLGISSSDPSGLKYVFMEMRKLEELELHVFGDLYDPYDDEEESDPWDPILTGLSSEVLASPGGRGDPDCLEEIGENPVSITNLQELRSLSVKDCRSFFIRYNDRYGSTHSLISDAVFEHAYLKMPKLTLLFFEGPFTNLTLLLFEILDQASEKMSDKWESDQRRTLISLPPFWEMD